MPLEIVHDVEKAVRQLMGAPKDLAEFLPPQGAAKPLGAATEAHRRLYREYVEDFEHAYDVAADWWEDCISAFVGLGHPRDAAIDLAFEKRLAGPASASEVVWFFRLYWLLCAEINAGLPEKDRVPPEVLLLGWLVDEKRHDYVALVTCMPYWPLGLDRNGNWC